MSQRLASAAPPGEEAAISVSVEVKGWQTGLDKRGSSKMPTNPQCKHPQSYIKPLFDLRAIYGHFAGTPFIQPHLATFKKETRLHPHPDGGRLCQVARSIIISSSISTIIYSIIMISSSSSSSSSSLLQEPFFFATQQQKPLSSPWFGVFQANFAKGNYYYGEEFKIHQRGVQWKQGVVIYMMLYTSLFYNTTPIHCTPVPLYPPVINTQSIFPRRHR